MTRGEIILWNKLKRNQMMDFDFHRQKPIGNYIVDFFCPDLKLIIEIDGPSHEGKEIYDKKREKYLCSLGFNILRFTEKQVYYSLSSILEIFLNLFVF